MSLKTSIQQKMTGLREPWLAVSFTSTASLPDASLGKAALFELQAVKLVQKKQRRALALLCFLVQ